MIILIILGIIHISIIIGFLHYYPYYYRETYKHLSFTWSGNRELIVLSCVPFGNICIIGDIIRGFKIKRGFINGDEENSDYYKLISKFVPALPQIPSLSFQNTFPKDSDELKLVYEKLKYYHNKEQKRKFKLWRKCKGK